MLRTLQTGFLKRQIGGRRSYATFDQARILRKYPVGATYHGFEIAQVQPVPEFSLVAVHLKHQRTGGQHLHLDAPADENNVFLVAFKTNPPDATGVPHILEHTTLCGSYKYPVRDPFFKMLNRSLSNFMNAMTGHDYTYFPFATTNAKDFENLMDVYLSSVFEPLLTYEDFTQEGWRLENENVEDINSDLVFKGVVYNEMKGQYSNSGYYYWIKFQEAIYKSLNNSGGDPKNITDLQYEDLIDFHTKSYHPSNAKTFTYGSLPLQNHLKTLDSMYHGFGARRVRNIIKESNFQIGDMKTNNVAIVNGPIDVMAGKPIEEQYQSSITWYLGNPLDESAQYEIFKWKVLNSLLCDGHSSPFYQELIEKQYGDDFTINSGLDSTTSLLSFSIGLTNLTEEKAKNLDVKVKEIIKDKILPEFQNNSPVFQERVEAILHQLELNFKKHKPDFGLGLLHSIVSTWVNDLNPIETLQVERILQEFKDDYNANGLKIFEDLLSSTLMNESTPTFKFDMIPDENFGNDLLKDEAERLSNKTKHLTEADKEIIATRGKKLLEKQQTEEDASVLPTLTISDIPHQGKFYGLEFGKINSKKLQKRVVNTNGLIYATAAKDFSYFPSKYYPYIPLFVSCLTNLAGTVDTSIIDLETKIQKLTGGVSFAVSNKTNPYNISETTLKFVATGMALSQNSNHIYDLWEEMLTKTKFTNETEVIEKLSTLIRNLGQNQMNTIAERGHSYASSYSGSQLTSSKNIRNMTSGIGQVEFIMELNKKLETQGTDFLTTELLPILKEIQDLVTSGYTEGQESGFEYSIIGDSATIKENETLIQKFDDNINSLGGNQISDKLTEFVKNFDESTKSINSNTLFDLPFQIGYCSTGKLGAEYTSHDGASLQVLAQLLSFKHLHSVIREANGAYGGGLSFDGLAGTLNFYSYRDPNPVKSLESFKESGKIAFDKLSSSWNENDLQEAKLAIFQSVDAPSNIALQGVSTFIEGITDEMRQERRERFLMVDNEDLKHVTEKYLINGNKQASTIIGDKSKLSLPQEDTWTVKTY